MFFESSSELPRSVDDLSGSPKDNLLAALALALGDNEFADRSLSFVDVLLPYLFFKYLAHELSAVPSFSVPARSGEFSRDLSACDERLLARSFPEDVAEPYPLECR